MNHNSKANLQADQPGAVFNAALFKFSGLVKKVSIA